MTRKYITPEKSFKNNIILANCGTPCWMQTTYSINAYMDV